jgi:hypothetical protein
VNPDLITSVFPTFHNGNPPRNWTFELPEKLGGLLRPEVYAEMCMRADTASVSLRVGNGLHAGHHGYDWVDESFLEPMSQMQGEGVCERSLTYMLESTDSAFGVMLLSLWSAYGLAKLENREFFINDRNWSVLDLPRFSPTLAIVLIGPQGMGEIQLILPSSELALVPTPAP